MGQNLPCIFPKKGKLAGPVKQKFFRNCQDITPATPWSKYMANRSQKVG